MKAAIVLALIGTVLAAPPLRLMPKPVPEQDPYAHIFAQVRPAAQPQQMEFQSQHHYGVSNNQVEMGVESAEQKHLEVENQQHHPSVYPNHQVEQEQKPPQHLGFEVKQQHQQNSAQGHLVSLGVKPMEQNRPQHLEVEIREQHSAPNHQMELEIKPMEQDRPHHLQVEIKEQHSSPNHIFEVKQQHQQENSAQGHLVSLGVKPQHLEYEISADHHQKPPQQIEQPQEDKPISYLQNQHFNLNLHQ